MKKLAIGLAFVLSTLLCGQLWAQETATQLFLAPSAVPLQVYTNYLTTTTGGSVTFSASQVGGTIIKNVAVLPNLNPGPGLDCSYTQSQLDAINVDNYQSYFAYTPTVDYSATSPGGADSTVTFNQPGLFFVQLTTDAGVSAPIEVAVDTDLLGQLGVTPTGPNRWIWSLFSPANRSSVVSGTLNTPQDGNLLGWVLGSLGGSDNIQLVAGGGPRRKTRLASSAASKPRKVGPAEVFLPPCMVTGTLVPSRWATSPSTIRTPPRLHRPSLITSPHFDLLAATRPAT